MIKNLPANAGEVSLIPDPGWSHMQWGNEACVPQVLSWHALEPVLHNKKSHCNEKPVHLN